MNNILVEGERNRRFFSLKVNCGVCGRKVGWYRFQLANKDWICQQCFKACGFTSSTPIMSKTVEEGKRLPGQDGASLQLGENFYPNKKVGNYLEIDEENQLWREMGRRIYRYTDIVDFELLEDGTSVVKGGLGRAIVGGALLGGVGAGVGGVTGSRKSTGICEMLSIKITVKDRMNPTVYLNFIQMPTKKKSVIYKNAYTFAQECLATLQLICSSVQTAEQDRQKELSEVDEVIKYKKIA